MAGVRLGVRGADDWLDLLFPPTCEVCGALCGVGRQACDDCDWMTRSLAAPACSEVGRSRCMRCASSLPNLIVELGLEGALCAACRRDGGPRVGVTVCVGGYGDPGLRELLLRYKHAPRPGLARPLGRALAARLAGFEAERPAGAGRARPGPLIVPVPLHFSRRFERGFDQAVGLARAIVEAGFGELALALRRSRAAPPQGSPFARARHRNVHGVFAVRRGAARQLAGRPLWLVDDVGTTLSTVSEAARCLRGAGPEFIGLALVARASPLNQKLGTARSVSLR